MNIEDHLDMLGYQVEDKVTKFKGVVDSVSFDLYGCIGCSVKPAGFDENGLPKEGCWFDITRLKVTSTKRVVDMPRFDLGYVAEGRKGPATKPVKRC